MSVKAAGKTLLKLTLALGLVLGLGQFPTLDWLPQKMTLTSKKG
jgi:hypothetical protein